MKLLSALIILFAYLSLVGSAKKEKMIVYLTSVDVTTHPRFLNSTVMVRRYNVAPYSSFDMSVTALQNLYTMMLQFSYYVRLGKTENILYERLVDLCDLFARPKERILKMVIDNLKRHGEMPAGCPVHPKRYDYTNITLNHIKLPPFLPETSFKLVIKCWQGPEKTLIFDSYWYGQLKKISIQN